MKRTAQRDPGNGDGAQIISSSWESFQKLFFCALFYLKKMDKLEAVDHPMMKDLKAVLQGERIEGYPTLEDIMDRMDLYDISSNKISRREEVNELLNLLGRILDQRVEALLIGGAVMLELGLKDATKDIDLVC